MTIFVSLDNVLENGELFPWVQVQERRRSYERIVRRRYFRIVEEARQIFFVFIFLVVLFIVIRHLSLYI